MAHLNDAQLEAYLARAGEFANPDILREAGRHIADCALCSKRIRLVWARSPDSPDRPDSPPLRPSWVPAEITQLPGSHTNGGERERPHVVPPSDPSASADSIWPPPDLIAALEAALARLLPEPPSTDEGILFFPDGSSPAGDHPAGTRAGNGHGRRFGWERREGDGKSAGNGVRLSSIERTEPAGDVPPLELDLSHLYEGRPARRRRGWVTQLLAVAAVASAGAVAWYGFVVATEWNAQATEVKPSRVVASPAGRATALVESAFDHGGLTDSLLADSLLARLDTVQAIRGGNTSVAPLPQPEASPGPVAAEARDTVAPAAPAPKAGTSAPAKPTTTPAGPRQAGSARGNAPSAKPKAPAAPPTPTATRKPAPTSLAASRAARPDSALNTGEWTATDRTAAEGLLGRPLVLVSGLGVESIAKPAKTGGSFVRVSQVLESGERVALVLSRTASANGAGRVPARLGTIRILPASPTNPTTMATARFGDLTVTARANLPPDSLRALLGRLALAPR